MPDIAESNAITLAYIGANSDILNLTSNKHVVILPWIKLCFYKQYPRFLSQPCPLQEWKFYFSLSQPCPLTAQGKWPIQHIFIPYFNRILPELFKALIFYTGNVILEMWHLIKITDYIFCFEKLARSTLAYFDILKPAYLCVNK